MTRLQLGILAGACVLNGAVLCTGATLVMSNSARVASVTTLQPTLPPTVPPTPYPTETPSPRADWIVHEHPTDGFAISLPPNWVELDLSAATMEEALAPARRYYPLLKNDVLEQQSLDEVRASGIKLVALDMESSHRDVGRFASLVVSTRLLDSEVALDELVKVTLSEFRERELGPVQHQRVEFPFGDAEELRLLRAEEQDNTVALMYIFMRRTEFFAVNVGYVTSEKDVYSPIVEQIMRGFALSP
jgi:hypothetical protein